MTAFDIAGIVLLAVAGVLLMFGLMRARAAGNRVLTTVSGRMSQPATLFLVGGIVSAIVGGGMILAG